ncbi:hypothetical protein HDU81_003329 [Chytriomyces hyalinus]|nr:hypothetical protein HDU81_003329 [Chytriomyces hyalinus]
MQVPAAQSLKLTNDTLTICIELDDGPTPVSASSATARQSLDSQSLYPLFPSAHYDPAMEHVFDKAALSDFAFIAEGKPIHVQRHVVAAKVSIWKPQIRHSLMKVRSPNNHPLAISIPMNAFAAQATLPYIQTALDARLLGQLCILAERFGAERKLLHMCVRRFDSLLTKENAVEMLQLFGHETDLLQEIIALLICKEFGAVRETSAFQSLISSFSGPADPKEQCMKSKRLLAILRRLKTGTAAMGNNTSEKDALSAPPVMDPVRLVAFRQLLSTRPVADVRFIIDGKVVFAQKCVLSSLSDFFRVMFSGAWSEDSLDNKNGVSVVRVEDFPHATLVAMLNYLYLLELDPHASLTDLGLLYRPFPTSSLAMRINMMLYTLARGYFVQNFNLVRKSSEFVHVVRAYWEYEDAI